MADRRAAGDIHYTPVRGSRLHLAEIELAVRASQCLGRRIGSREELEREVAAWKEARNERKVEVGARRRWSIWWTERSSI